MEGLIVISVCIASISFAITTTSIFEWLRHTASKIHPKIEELIHCPYCLSYWITFAMYIPLYGMEVVAISGNYFYDFVINLFTIPGLSALMHFVMLRAYEPVTRRKLRKLLDDANKRE